MQGEEETGTARPLPVHTTPQAAAEAVIEKRVPTTHYVAIGHPAEEIVYRAKDIDADLIVLGSRGLTPVERILLGSVSKRVLQLADRPVTIVPV